jgi:predicted O-methyltransferase YrrM
MSLKEMMKSLLRRIPPVRRLLDERDSLHYKITQFGNQLPFVPNGHFYSPVPAFEEIRRDEARIFRHEILSFPGIDLAQERQFALLQVLKEHYKELNFPEHRAEGFRFFYDNPYYSYSDAIFLYSMIRHAKPKKIIEIGSGHSSCVTLDTNERFFDGSISCIFIEPYPERLFSLLKQEDLDRVRVVPERLQDVDLEVFQGLSRNDILFIDSTHVSKTGSDVNRIFFEILPALASGVYIHFHDIFYPFEYPKEWVYEGRAWNELYLLRAFLQYNSQFEITCFNTFLQHVFKDFFVNHMPLCLKNPGGSIWLQKQ